MTSPRLALGWNGRLKLQGIQPETKKVMWCASGARPAVRCPPPPSPLLLLLLSAVALAARSGPRLGTSVYRPAGATRPSVTHGTPLIYSAGAAENGGGLVTLIVRPNTDKWQLRNNLEKKKTTYTHTEIYFLK
ncbi:hypothetical protein EVAR_27916_1 [Eumeta japonica]|uniref:Uncharacterized protein n=1 Tax=Eumeta variegata TaxID=151549 RepID=A0A4C1UWD5_EUMVA|nr:hypothetical protein EVAR_27916_1 [Eumeta japonica]